MEDHSASDSSISPAPTLPRRVPVDAELARFSPATAPQRDAIDSFCRASRPWALRQAKRTYRHLPESLREQAVDRAYADLRTRTPASTERRVLSAELAERMTEALRHVHVGWCLNESSALLRREGTEPVQPEVRRDDLSAFVDNGLGGLERAILQLEIGAGRDTRSSRAALRLHPRAYAQHREAGFSKLRDAICAQVIGRACDQHVSGVVAAATGDRAAMDELATGSRRCRFCAREAQGLRSVLHERLAVAPWPIAIKPAGLLAAKLGAVGAIFGTKGAGVGSGVVVAGAGGGGSGASMAASVLAVAALATGTAAIAGHDATPRERAAGHSASAQQAAAPAATAASTTTTRTVAAGSAAKKARKQPSARKAGHTKLRRGKAHNGGSGGSAKAPAGSAPSTSSSSSSSGTTVASTGTGSKPSGGTVGAVTKPVTDAVDNAVKPVTDSLPSAVASPVQSVVDDATDTVDNVVDAVDQLLPKKP